MQDLIVYLIVAAAAFYVGRLLWQSLAGKKGCGCGSVGGCPKMATKPQVPQSGLIQISLNGAAPKADARNPKPSNPK